MGEFFAMGKYGAYVWFAYGVTFVALVLLFVWSWFGARSRETELEQVRQLARAGRRSPDTSLSPGSIPSAGQDNSESTSPGGVVRTAAAGSQASE